MTTSKYGNLERFPSVKGVLQDVEPCSLQDLRGAVVLDECDALQIPLFPVDDSRQMLCTAMKPCRSPSCTLCNPSWKKD